jgi:hypothetical protein
VRVVHRQDGASTQHNRPSGLDRLGAHASGLLSRRDCGARYAAVHGSITRSRGRAANLAIDLRLHPGGEIFPDGARDLGRAELDLIAHGPAGARSDTLGAIGRSQLTEANPRFLLEHGIPAEPSHQRAWRSLHEHRMRAAIVAARELRHPGR